MYCKTHEVNVPFCMSDFLSSKIINHHFRVNNDKGESGIRYEIIIGCDLMVNLVLTADSDHQVVQWYGATIHMKEPSSFIGKFDLTKC